MLLPKTVTAAITTTSATNADVVFRNLKRQLFGQATVQNHAASLGAHCLTVTEVVDSSTEIADVQATTAAKQFKATHVQAATKLTIAADEAAQCLVASKANLTGCLLRPDAVSKAALVTRVAATMNVTTNAVADC